MKNSKTKKLLAIAALTSISFNANSVLANPGVSRLDLR